MENLIINELKLTSEYNKKLTTKQIDCIFKTLGFNKINKNKNDLNYYETAYDFNIYLENFNSLFYAKIENPTAKCKFYSFYGRFTNKEVFEQIEKQTFLPINIHSGKCNNYPPNLKYLIMFLNGVLLQDKNFKNECLTK